MKCVIENANKQETNDKQTCKQIQINIQARKPKLKKDILQTNSDIQIQNPINSEKYIDYKTQSRNILHTRKKILKQILINVK